MPIWYWDANLWLGILKEEEDKLDTCLELLESAERGEAKIVVSAVTLAEVVHVKGRERLTQDVEETIRSYFMGEHIVVRACDRLHAETARALMWKYDQDKLRDKDAIHLATAALANVDVLHSYDPDLLQLNGALERQDGVPLKIAQPFVEQERLLRVESE